MNLKDLIAKMDLIEADAAPAGRIDYQANQAQDAKEKAIADVKQMASTPMNAIPRFGIAIDPKTGQIFYGDDGGDSSHPQPKGYPFKWMQAGGPAESIKDGARIKGAGLEIIDKGGYAYVDPGKLSTIDQPVPPTPTPPGPVTDPVHNPNQDKGPEEDIAQLNQLVDQLNTACGGSGGNPVPPVIKQKPQGWEAHKGQNTAGGAAVGNPNITAQGKKAGATQVPDVPLQKTTGYQPSAAEAQAILDNGQPNDILRYGGRAKLQQIAAGGAVKESFIAESLIASFGYELDEDAGFNSAGVYDPTGLKAKFDAADKAAGMANAQKGMSAMTQQAPAAVDAGKDAQAALKARLQSGNGIAKQTSGLGNLPAAEKQIASNLASKGIKTVAPDAAKMALKAGAGKLFSKLIPGLGLVVGTLDAIDRAKKGDYVGAGMAGLSAVLSLGGPLTAAASMGLDAANMARDYNKTGDAFGGAPDMNNPQPTPTKPNQGGNPTAPADPKVQELQKRILAKDPNALPKYGADGRMGPETQAAMTRLGISESNKSLAETMKDLQENLALIESKAVIKESLGNEYFLDENFFILDENGEYVTDLLTIAVINESAEEGNLVLNEASLVPLIGQGLKKAGQFATSAFKGSRALPGAGERLAQTGKNLSNAEKAGLKVGSKVAKHPFKTAAAATGAGALAGLAFGGGSNPTLTPPGPGPGPGPNQSGNKVDCKDLAAKIKELMSHEWQGDEWIKATGNARVALDKFEKTDKLQLAADQQNASQNNAPAPTPTGIGNMNSASLAPTGSNANTAIPSGAPPATTAPQPAPAPVGGQGANPTTFAPPTQYAESLDEISVLKDMLARFK